MTIFQWIAAPTCLRDQKILLLLRANFIKTFLLIRPLYQELSWKCVIFCPDSIMRRHRLDQGIEKRGTTLYGTVEKTLDKTIPKLPGGQRNKFDWSYCYKYKRCGVTPWQIQERRTYHLMSVVAGTLVDIGSKFIWTSSRPAAVAAQQSSAPNLQSRDNDSDSVLRLRKLPTRFPGLGNVPPGNHATHPLKPLIQ